MSHKMNTTPIKLFNKINLFICSIFFVKNAILKIYLLFYKLKIKSSYHDNINVITNKS